MDMPTNLNNGFTDALAGAQDKAKEAFEKSTAMLGDAGSFARGNVEAVVESSKILAAGLQDMSTNLVAESRGVFETLTADLKELAASKTPADFFKIQGEMMRKSLDSAVAYGSKNSEAMVKLASEAIAPLSSRVNIAVEKAKTTIG
jgi:phasin family protein